MPLEISEILSDWSDSLSMPRLSTVGDTEQYYDRYVQIRTYGNPLNISLPSLSDLTIIALGGTIGSSVAAQPLSLHLTNLY